MNIYNRYLRMVLICIVLCYANPSDATILNPSFEFEHDALMPNGVSTSVNENWGMPDDWPWRNSGNTNAHGIHPTEPEEWNSHGDWSLYVFASTAGVHSTGDYIEFYQSVDMTGMTELLFDVYLEGGTYTNSYVAIDSQKLWVRNQNGTLYDVTLDVSNFTGNHEIELGVEVFQSFGDSADGWTYFDNVRLVPEPATICLLGLGCLLLRKRKRA